MSKNIRTQLGKVIGKSLNSYHARVKPIIDDIKFKEQYQGRIIDCMVGEVDDNYIETPEIDAPIVKLEHSKEGLVKVPSIKGKTILVDADGNETDTPAEGCRLVSVGEEEDNKMIILSKNKNLFNGEIERYFINSSTGQNNGWMEYWRSKDYIRCIPNEKYLINFKYKGVKKSGAIFFYDKDKNYIGMTYANPTVTPSNCEFIRITGQAENSGTLIDITKVTDIMLCKGVDVADYIEPKQHKTEILLNEPLRKIDDTIYDEIIGNKIIRRCKLINLDDRHCELLSVEPPSGRKSYYISLVPYGFPSYPTPSFAGNKLLLSDETEIGILIGTNNANPPYFGFDMDENKFPTAEKVKEYLRENNIQILVSLAEPIIEEVPNSITTQGFDDTTMYIENSITPTVSYGYNALIPYKEELSKQKEEVETNTLDIENNIIPYLMDMEFNLMLMEDNE